MARPTAIEPVAQAWRSALGRAPANLAVALVCLVGLLAAWLGRWGTPAARSSAVGLLLLALVTLIWRRWHEARVWADERRTLRRALLAADRELGARVLRAHRLVEEAESGALFGSAELAHWQFQRVLGGASLDRVAGAARRQARRLGWLATVIMLVVLAVLLPSPLRLIEGYDVLLARGGQAPVALWWLDSLSSTAQLPAYLRLSPRTLLAGDTVELPRGSVIAVSGVPRHPGRTLLLTDGTRQVPFVADGRGGVVAHYTLERDAELTVAARYGDVLIRQPEPLVLKSSPDTAPQVELEGAPRTVQLGEIERLELFYRATDDHGLKEVDLVLRSGEREERRVLSRLDGESTHQSGGHALGARDRFLARSVLPVTVSIEAKDNDAMHGPNWGRSAAITVIPSVVGTAEAGRLAALVAARDALVDLLGWRLDPGHPVGEEAGRAREAARLLRNAVDEVHAGLAVPGGLKAFLRGQAAAVEATPRPVRQLENAVLAVDVALHGLAQRDARSVALRLGELGEEVARGAKAAGETEARRAGLERVRSAFDALQLGIDQLLRLGELGADLGSVARADAQRIESARQRDDLWHVELAARHLAARLSRPNPSFLAGWRGGVESGGAREIESQRASEADQKFDELMRELAELTFEHGSGLDRLEQARSEAEQAGVDDPLRTEAAERARELGELVSRLPRAGEDSTSARGAAGIARQEVEAMADELGRLALRRALENGRAALGSLEQARHRAQRQPDQELIAQVESRLRQALDWTGEMLGQARQRSEAGMRSSLEQGARREQELARRASSLALRAGKAEASLPDDAVQDLDRASDLMQDASTELGQGRAERGLSLGHAAQELLERLGTGRTTDPDEGDRGNPKPPLARAPGVSTGGGYVPDRAGDSTEAFRRRVVEGLGDAGSGRLGPAVRRYAEGLLR